MFWYPLAQAHHSFAQFDMSKMSTLTGTVKDWKFGNPHTWLIMEVIKADGTTEEWSLVGSSPNMMIRWGWNAADVKTGAKVTVDVRPARDGQHNGALQNLFLPDGKVLMDPGGRPGKDLAAGPSGAPTKPQGEVYK
jgi:hypothetical protein